MKNQIKLSVLALGMLVALGGTISSCKKNKNCDETKISENGQSESHNNGRDCMECHKSSGDGEGCFNIAGSVFNSGGGNLSGGTVRLFSEPNAQGTLLATLQIDNLGNFFTTGDFVVGNGYYPQVEDANGNIKNMPTLATSGSCNSCHGVNTAKIEMP